MAKAPDTQQFELAGLNKILRAAEDTPGSLDYTTELRATLSAALKDTEKTRSKVAARMSELTGQDITKAMLDAWTAESRTQWRFPFEFAAAFEAATGSFALQALLARKRGTTVLAGAEVLEAELGAIQHSKQRLEAREKNIMTALKVASS